MIRRFQATPQHLSLDNATLHTRLFSFVVMEDLGQRALEEQNCAHDRWAS